MDKLDNLLMNMNAGLLPENLCEDEIKILKDKYGDDWFHKLGYCDSQYKNPIEEGK